MIVSSADSHGTEHAELHVASRGLYVTIFGTLMLLTAVTVKAAFMDLGHFGLAVALAIACFKATLVVLYFMHVKYELPLVKIMVPIGLGFVALLILFVFADVASRSWIS